MLMQSYTRPVSSKQGFEHPVHDRRCTLKYRSSPVTLPSRQAAIEPGPQMQAFLHCRSVRHHSPLPSVVIGALPRNVKILFGIIEEFAYAGEHIGTR